jgi:DNA-binding IclR family transcriptional regulator
VELLHALSDWRSLKDLARVLDADAATVRRALAALERRTLVER